MIKPPYPSATIASKRVLLASNSPRRRELLGLIVPQFEIARLKDVDETYPADLPSEEVPEYLSKLKAAAYTAQMEPDDLVITADTVVIINNRILGKPRDAGDAIEMLHELSGNTHRVVTGVTLTWDCGASQRSFSAVTDVTFGRLNDCEINDYVALYRPFDKAGAYGIQEWIGAIGIERIDGSYYNVMGLPVKKLYDFLKTI